MADTTISSLPLGTPSGNNILPYSTGSNTLGVSVSAIFQNNTSNIGIGVHNPQSTLHLSDDVGDIRIDSTAVVGASWRILPQTGMNRKLFRIYDQHLGVDRLVIDSTGNVGIGTLYPSVKLDIDGDVNISGNLKAGGLSRLYAALTSGPYTYPSGIVKWNAVLLSTDNNYNSSTGYYTATKQGIYRVSAYWISSGAGDYMIKKNNSNYAVAHNNHNDTWDNSSITCVVSLNIGDTISFHYLQAAGYSGGLYGNAYNGYSIEQLP